MFVLLCGGGELKASCDVHTNSAAAINTDNNFMSIIFRIISLLPY
jgi:hypothetical protein